MQAPGVRPVERKTTVVGAPAGIQRIGHQQERAVNTTTGPRLRLADLIGALSIVADLGFGLPPEEAMRSCLIGTALARKAGVPEDTVADVFYATLLQHGGCNRRGRSL